MSDSVFIGQLRSNTGEHIEVWLRKPYGAPVLSFGLVDTTGHEPRKVGVGLTFDISELDQLQGLIMNAKVRAGSFA